MENNKRGLTIYKVMWHHMLFLIDEFLAVTQSNPIFLLCAGSYLLKIVLN